MIIQFMVVMLALHMKHTHMCEKTCQKCRLMSLTLKYQDPFCAFILSFINLHLRNATEAEMINE